MDLLWNDGRKKKFATTVGLVTSSGPHGNNIMACEWTRQVSYSPGLILVSIGNGKASADNIKASGEFGVNLASINQNVFVNVAGMSSGRKIDKIAVLRELGAKFSNGKKINAFMVDGSAFQAECKVVKTIELGTHTTFIGKIVELYPLSNKEPLIYYDGKYVKPGEIIPKPSADELEKIKSIVEKYAKKEIVEKAS